MIVDHIPIHNNCSTGSKFSFIILFSTAKRTDLAGYFIHKTLVSQSYFCLYACQASFAREVMTNFGQKENIGRNNLATQNRLTMMLIILYKISGIDYDIIANFLYIMYFIRFLVKLRSQVLTLPTQGQYTTDMEC